MVEMRHKTLRKSDQCANFAGFVKIGYAVVSPLPQPDCDDGDGNKENTPTTKPTYSASGPFGSAPEQTQASTVTGAECSLASGDDGACHSIRVFRPEEHGSLTPGGWLSGHGAGQFDDFEFRKGMGAPSQQEGMMEPWTASAWSMDPIHEIDPKDEGEEIPADDGPAFSLESLDITCLSMSISRDGGVGNCGDASLGEGGAGVDDDQGALGASDRSNNDASLADTVLNDASDIGCFLSRSSQGSCTLEGASPSPTLSATSPIPPSKDREEEEEEEEASRSKSEGTVRRSLAFREQRRQAAKEEEEEEEEDEESCSHKGSAGAEYGWSAEMRHLDECDLGDGCVARGCVRRRTSSGGSYLKGLYVL